jgi:WXG100 family type VII secretion target
MATYTVNHEVVAGVIENMAAVNGHVNELIANLNGSTERSLGEWTSTAREAYNKNRGQWNAAAAQMNDHLARAQGALGSIRENYLSAERQGSAMWE